MKSQDEPGPEPTKAQKVWAEALARPSFKAALDEGLADIAAGRVVSGEAVLSRLRAVPAEPQPAVEMRGVTCDYGNPPCSKWSGHAGDHGRSEVFDGIADAVAALRAAPAEPQPAVEVELRDDLDSDAFRDDHERAIRAHILEGPEDHRCDDLCSAAIIDRLVGKHPINEYPKGSDLLSSLAALPTATEPADGTLDEAWKAAEAALPEGVELFLTKDVLNEPEARYEVEASARTLTEGRTGADWTFSADFKAQYASGPTPAAALLALAAALSRPASPAIAARDGGEGTA